MLNCKNGGSCKHGEKDFSNFEKVTEKVLHIPFLNLTNINFVHCECPEGFTGVQCDIPVEKCKDHEHYCFNGAECVDPTKKKHHGHWCDCSKSPDKTTTFSGFFCEHAASAFCEFGKAVSEHSYCANGGGCKDTIIAGEEHVGCDCREEWTGEHCEFHKESTLPIPAKKTTVTTATLTNQASAKAAANPSASSSSGGFHPGAIAYVVLVVVFAFAVTIAILLVVRQIRKGKARDVETGNSLELDADGSGSLHQSPTTAGTPIGKESEEAMDTIPIEGSESGEEGEII